MNRKVLIGVAAGLATAAIPAVASASMAYITAPTNPRVKQWVTVANDSGGSPQRIDTGVSAAISPDGARIAYQKNGSATAAAPTTIVRDLASGQAAYVTGGCQLGLTWSPDSKWIACPTQTVTGKGIVTGDGLGLVAVPATIDGATPLAMSDYIAAAGNEVSSSVAFSPDSSTLAFSLRPFSSRAIFGTLYAAPVANSAARTLLVTSGDSPVWGQDGLVASRGKNVTVRQGRTRMRMWHTQLWGVQPDGTGAHQITHYRASGFTEGAWARAWVPGGQALVGAIVGQDESNPSVISLPGGAVRSLNSRDVSNPVAVSADGQRVLIQGGMDAGDSSIQRVGINGKGWRTLVKNAGGVSVTSNWNG